MAEKLSIYMLQATREQQPLQRLQQLATDRARSVNDPATQAQVEVVKREEQTDDQG